MNRTSGILLPISSLPSKYGIGCFSKEAYDFVDWLKKAGQCYWQILPLVPTSYGDSPYQSFSTYAGNPYFIDLEKLIEEGVLTKEECDEIDFGNNKSDIDYEKIYNARYVLLRKAYENSNISQNDSYNKFVHENAWWLKDYALFMAVKNRFGGQQWTEWAEDIRLRYGYAIEYYQRELYFDIEFQQYMQFKFYEQWTSLKEYANKNGVKIIGDIPIYVAMDSADVWANPELFLLDSKNVPIAVAGCPPDGFSATGQLWGNPLYRWDYHQSTGYTGTHDNETINGWLKTISENEKKMVKEYLNAKYIPDEELYWAIVCEVMKSHAHMCIIPMQDYLGCDNNSRINQPSTVGKNWRWRITEEELSTDIQKKIREITRRYGRLCWQWEKLLDIKQSK